MTRQNPSLHPLHSPEDNSIDKTPIIFVRHGDDIISVARYRHSWPFEKKGSCGKYRSVEIKKKVSRHLASRRRQRAQSEEATMMTTIKTFLFFFIKALHRGKEYVVGYLKSRSLVISSQVTKWWDVYSVCSIFCALWIIEVAKTTDPSPPYFHGFLHAFSNNPILPIANLK